MLSDMADQLYCLTMRVCIELSHSNQRVHENCCIDQQILCRIHT